VTTIRASDLSGVKRFAGQVPLSDVVGKRGKNRQSCGCVVSIHGEVELRLIGVLVIVNTMVWDDISYRAAVYGEQPFEFSELISLKFCK